MTSSRSPNGRSWWPECAPARTRGHGIRRCDGVSALSRGHRGVFGAARGVRCHPSQILVTTGSQQALQLCARVLLNPGDRVCLEEPGYPGARDAFRASGAEVVAVPLDHGGIDVDRIARQVRSARAVYVTPSHQYPLGMAMSATRRMQLLRWASDASAWLIEDDYDSEYRFGGRPIASLQGMDAHERVIYVGTFSKVMFPALRLGYLVAPTDLVQAFSMLGKWQMGSPRPSTKQPLPTSCAMDTSCVTSAACACST